MARATGWDIQSLVSDKDQLNKAQEEWLIQSHGRLILDQKYTQLNLDQEVGWIEDTLIELLNKHSKVMRVTSYSERWWNKEVAQARKEWAKEKKLWG